MYRDDVCAVCGESLPPDHLYCRLHASDVDERLHEIADLLPQVGRDAERLAALLDGIAAETWDYLAEREADDPDWPPTTEVGLRLDPEQVDVDVDREPGYVRIDLRLELVDVLAAVGRGLRDAADPRFVSAAASAEGAGATH